MQNNDISKKMNMERHWSYFTGCLQFTSKFSAHNCFCREKLFHAEKNSWPRTKTLRLKIYNIT